MRISLILILATFIFSQTGEEIAKMIDDEKTWAEFIVEKENKKLYEVVFIFNAENNKEVRSIYNINLIFVRL